MDTNTDKSMPQDEPSDESIMVNMSSLGDSAKDLKVGDTVPMEVKAIQGDMVELCPCDDDDSDEDTDPKTMPLDKLEASLPKAPERE